MRTFLIAAFCIALMSCGFSERKPRVPETVDVPVSVSCLKEIPQEPTYIFETLPEPKTPKESADQVRILWGERDAAILYGRSWAEAVAGCKALRN